MSLRNDIQLAINSHSAENASNTPDFVLAQFLMDALAAFDLAVNRREDWYHRPVPPGSLGQKPDPVSPNPNFQAGGTL